MSEYKSEPIFVDGLFIKDRTEKTPDFILACYSINVQKFQTWLATHQDKAVNGWLNIDIKKSDKGVKYAQLNTYKKEAVTEPQVPLDTSARNERFNFKKEEPFINCRCFNKDINVEDIPF